MKERERAPKAAWVTQGYSPKEALELTLRDDSLSS